MTELKQYIFERGQMKARLTRFKTALDQMTPGEDKIGLAVKLEKVEALFDRFIQLKIEEAAEGTDQAPIQELERARFEDVFYELVTRARRFIEADKEKKLRAQKEARLTITTAQRYLPATMTDDGQARIKVGSKLPIIKLKEFDGSYDQWVKFRDTFKSMIHDIPKITKFYDLDSALQKDARRAIESLGVSEAIYDSAWQRLLDRFEDTTVLIDNHVKALFELTPMSKGSSSALQQLIDDFLTKQRKYLEKSMDQGSTSKPNSRPSTTTKSGKLGSQTRGTASATYVSAEIPGCPMCGSSHYLYNCEEFAKLSVKDRIFKVQQKRLCFNFLRGKHRNVDCTLGPCKKCPLKHNTLLHIEQNNQPKH
ncbi:uncharacterized protein LOC118645359 [Monomorium pharaonis]|uniref:uncharacterized protein LOC118645359 n=1 Tax=Monomorium pharaonis TaxID=307658 RepID=UPI001747C584|nr:uncharacterized protein LOC118645359 [Monomorium pharaonis]